MILVIICRHRYRYKKFHVMNLLDFAFSCRPTLIAEVDFLGSGKVPECTESSLCSRKKLPEPRLGFYRVERYFYPTMGRNRVNTG